MTTLVLFLLAGALVSWVVVKAARTDRTDETDQFAHVQEIVAGWTEESRASQSRGSQSRNDLGNKG